MIIDVLKGKGVCFRCENCGTYFAWKPDKHGKCDIRLDQHYICDKIECANYEPADRKCPECGNVYITEIPIIVYKIKRWLRW